MLYDLRDMSSAMRESKEILENLVKFAEHDHNVRAVMLNGSRVNQNAPEDIYQDYDVIFFVVDAEKEFYKKDQSWIHQFGQLVICQQNNFGKGDYIFLMQFADGVRIDLTFKDIAKIHEEIEKDSLSKILLDKDHTVRDIADPSEETYYVKRPSQEEWESTLNEIWWIQIYIAREICRDELPFARYLYDAIFMVEIVKLLSWFIGNEYDWKINVGKCGKWFKRLLRKELYDEFKELYSNNDYQDIWRNMRRARTLVRQIGLELGNKLHYQYPLVDDNNVTDYLSKFDEIIERMGEGDESMQLNNPSEVV